MSDAYSIFKEMTDKDPRKSVAIFDLDSTLFRVLERTQQILVDMANDPRVLTEYPEHAELFRQIRVLESDWGVHEALRRLGITEHDSIFKLVRKYWRKHFFSSRYLDYDQPYPGAVEFVNALHELGMPILYLTGRDEGNMWKGTVKSLRKWKFPLVEESHLHMKTNKGEIVDEVFKSQRLTSIKEPGATWFFENEPIILKRVEVEHPDISLVFLDTVHSGRAPAPNHLRRLTGDYRFQIGLDQK
jgi:hypothetical protein